jgi:hypothetical protein
MRSSRKPSDVRYKNELCSHRGSAGKKRDVVSVHGRPGKLFLHDSGFGSEFHDESIAPLVLCIHQLRYLLSQFRLFRRIDNPAQPHILVAVHLERDSGMVLDVPNPMRLITVLRDEIESSLMPDVPDFYSVRCPSLPAFSSKIEKLMFAVLQKPRL